MLLAGYSFVFFVFCQSYVYSKRTIPKYIDLCHRHDPNLETCLRKAIEKIRPHMREGLPDLFIPPANPLVVPQASLDSGDNFKALFKNIEVYYADEFKLDHLKVDLDNLKIEIGLSFDRLKLVSQYFVDGKLLILQVKGHGPADGNFTNVSGKLFADGKFVKKKGKDHLDIKSHSIEMNLGKPVLHFDNLFRNNSELNEQTNKILNENIVEIIDELRPVVNQAVSDVILGMIRRLFEYYSFDELFPE